MTRIITPGLFLVAAMLTSACTDDEVDAPPSPGPDTDPAACCRPTAPPTSDTGIDSFDLGRRSRERLDRLNRIASHR